MGEWRALVGRCKKKASRKHIHELRVATLRLQVELSSWQVDRAPRDSGSKEARRWNRQADKVRKLLSPVRDADVFLQMLEGMDAAPAEASEGDCALSEKCKHEIAVLHRKLERKRETASAKLAAALKERAEKLDRAAKELETMFSDEKISGAIVTAGAIKALLDELSWDAPTLTAATLHDFRKKAKTARYLAEISHRGAALRNLALVLKRMQAAAGVWHDWQALCEKANTKLGSSAPDGLARWLETKAEHALAAALGECRRSMIELEDVRRANVAPNQKKLPSGHAIDLSGDRLRLA